ncbi:glycoside hydrolase family 16 protein [Cytobacillus dafuensis]|uniref:Glycoside hydrolase family 16 protein n=1 Tax=Cytobacillus dafuensis TaxID=1742359 RepID=A0A5B8Z1E5_CYTDA|nr:glycoside hydrolase family 16 protein [Cytobacillus dafuensis]QED46832.1 glycoside hydrolase family 16 protein [Cytobacillus dafuensis]
MGKWVNFLFLFILAAGFWVSLYFIYFDDKKGEVESPDSLKGIHDNTEIHVDESEAETGESEVEEMVSHNGWELVWEEDFEGFHLDQSKWNIEEWAAEKNNELQFYSHQNLNVEKGFLNIISKEEEKGDRKYTSGAIHSKDKFSFLYGKVEMRAKLPSGQGVFPAFWMMPNADHIWLPEIDIMEMLGHKPEEIWMVMHWQGEDRSLKSLSSNYIGEDYSNGFHVFGIEWTPKEIIWIIDGVERFRVDHHIPQEEMYLYLNTAVGGDWPGSPDHTTQFPVLFQVDYVKVYQQTGG